MARIEILNATKHAGLRIRRDIAPPTPHLVPVVATELRELAVEYPVVLVKNPETGQFGLFALLGFREGENLFAGGNKSWLAHYIPIDIRRQPFVVARGKEEGKGAVAIDLESPLISESDGQPIFGEDGGGLVKDIQPVLAAGMSGLAPTQALVAALNEHDLIAPGRIEVPDPDGAFTLEGFYTLSSANLATLSGEALADLNSKGLLFAAHLILASMANVAKLLARRSSRTAN